MHACMYIYIYTYIYIYVIGYKQNCIPPVLTLPQKKRMVLHSTWRIWWFHCPTIHAVPGIALFALLGVLRFPTGPRPPLGRNGTGFDGLGHNSRNSQDFRNDIQWTYRYTNWPAKITGSLLDTPRIHPIQCIPPGSTAIPNSWRQKWRQMSIMS